MRMKEKIQIRNAYEHNLKHLNLDIPLEAFTCVTGCSGCGKSSLVFDTIYAESQRGLLEGITGNIYGQKLMNKPKVGSIENLRPALNISQNYYNVNPRSTVGTVSEISYYVRSLFALCNSTTNHIVSESIFSANNPKSFCPNCSGLGVEHVVSEDLLIPDKDKTLREGGILFFKGAPESKEQKYLEALCDQYDIDIDTKIRNLSSAQLHLLLYADENIRYLLSYKEGRRRKKHYVDLNGAMPSILNQRSAMGEISDDGGPYAQYMSEVPCHICHGAKLSPDVLLYHVGDKNYADIEKMELSELNDWLSKFEPAWAGDGKQSIAVQIVTSIRHRINSLILLDVGYLSLNRPIPTLSGGERQRVRIAAQLTCSLKGLIYILDEPCKGLHERDISKLVTSTESLISRGNTVIAIEHNPRYIAAADHVVELGPVGGPKGGYLINESDGISKKMPSLAFRPEFKFHDYVSLHSIKYHNIQNQNIEFPIGGITCITGVSGSGKTSLAYVIAKCCVGQESGICKAAIGMNSIHRVIRVDQAPIGKTPRSTIVSYLGIYDEIRNLFASTPEARKNKMSASMFSMNLKGGRCECCQGTGLKKIELNYLPDTFITCPECGGSRFHEEVLKIHYNDKNIRDILETPIEQVLDVFTGTKKIEPVLRSMISLGLGYLRLGQMSMNLSGGEAQRIKLARALGTPSRSESLYILDEPTSGLNDVDIERFISVIETLRSHGDTILIIEHNIPFIAKCADYIIDFGIYGGTAGGRVVAQGTARKVFSDPASSIYGLYNLEGA